MNNLSTRPEINWNRAKLERFKQALAQVEGFDTVFTFDGHEFVAGYAKYLYEYLYTKLAP